MLAPFAALMLGPLAFTPFMLTPLLLAPFVVVPVVVIGARWQCAHAAQKRYRAQRGDQCAELCHRRLQQTNRSGADAIGFSARP
jgi:hypothetical protein